MLSGKVREWRAKLSTKAKQEKRYRFYSLICLRKRGQVLVNYCLDFADARGFQIQVGTDSPASCVVAWDCRRSRYNQRAWLGCSSILAAIGALRQKVSTYTDRALAYGLSHDDFLALSRLSQLSVPTVSHSAIGYRVLAPGITRTVTNGLKNGGSR